MFFYAVPVIVPFAVGHLIWTWCYYSFPSSSYIIIGQTNTNPFFSGNNNGLYNYAPCSRGEFWNPDNVSYLLRCIRCYCITGYVSQCFLNSNCPTLPDSTTTTSTTTTTASSSPLSTTSSTTTTLSSSPSFTTSGIKPAAAFAKNSIESLSAASKAEITIKPGEGDDSGSSVMTSKTTSTVRREEEESKRSGEDYYQGSRDRTTTLNSINDRRRNSFNTTTKDEDNIPSRRLHEFLFFNDNDDGNPPPTHPQRTLHKAD